MNADTRLAGRVAGLALTAAIVELTMTSAYIHLTLGGPLFTLNAAGYAALAAAIAVGAAAPTRLIARFAWLPRIGLAGFTAATIIGYLVIGPYFTLGWATKAIELAILILLAADTIRVYGSPTALVRAVIGSLFGPGPMRPA